jgi:PhnB protein
MRLLTQLNFGGNCAEAFAFYAQHLGGKVTMIMRQNEMPDPPPNATDAVIHARMTLGNTELIGNDVPGGHFERMRSVYMYLGVDSAKEAERVYGLLSEGGEVYMALQETFYATRFAMLRDRFGVSWTVIHERARQDESKPKAGARKKPSKKPAKKKAAKKKARR